MAFEFLNYVVDFSILDLLAIFFAAAIIALAIFSYLSSRGKLNRSLNMALFSVTLPREIKEETKEKEKNEKELIAVMEQLYATLSRLDEGLINRILYGRLYFSFEIAVEAAGQEIGFYIVAPRKFEKLIEKQIHSFYYAAQIERVEDYNIFSPGSIVAGRTIVLNKNFIFPVRTYQNLDFDPLNNITNTLSKLPIGEGAAIQIMIRPSLKRWRTQSFTFTRQIQEEGLQKAIYSQNLMAKISKFFQSKIKKDKEGRPMQKEPIKLSPLDEEAIKLIEGKANKTGFEVNVRIVASAPTKEKAENIADQIESSFSQFNSPNFNSFRAIKFGKDFKKISYDFIFRNFEKKYAMILNTEELASIFHFPTVVLETPKVKWLHAKNAPAPANIGSEGLILGYNAYRGETTVVKIAKEDRRRHLYTIGQTGTGKSTFLGEMIKRDIAAGEGVCVIDPHGDLIDDVLTAIPENRAEEVVVFDPSDATRPVGLNMLEVDTEEQKDFAVQEMIAIFYKLFPPEMIGPMFEHNMRNVMLTLMADKEYPGTIAEIPRMFT
ncbi:ATP-binding protein, partial [Patescibacteria group bacterium]|nr:ATP-binding protein [Patescibacteria group bacterium]